jgi:hypothetical protein
MKVLNLKRAVKKAMILLPTLADFKALKDALAR